MLYDQISGVLDASICDSESTYKKFLERLEEGAFTRDENPQTHFCTYFLPYNPKDRKVFLVHHKKSGLWLSPGGHIDEGEGLLETLNREIHEELGLESCFKETPLPFLFTITPIENASQSCKKHFDVWYLVHTDGADFHIDPREFHDVQWMAIEDAERLVTDPPNKRALELAKAKK